MNRKMKACKTCGADIARNANVCPHCGANLAMRKSAVVIGLIIWVIAVFFMARACTASGVAQSSTESGSDVLKPEISITAADLWKAYSNNQVNADNAYNGKVVSISGEIANIGRDILSGDPCISLKTDSAVGVNSIQCFFESGSQTDEIAALSDGDSITISGECDGMPVANVQILKCVIS